MAGVTRDRVIEMLGQRGCAVTTRALTLEEVLTADEVWICNSLIGAWQVRSLGEQTWEKQPLVAELRKTLELENALAH